MKATPEAINAARNDFRRLVPLHGWSRSLAEIKSLHGDEVVRELSQDMRQHPGSGGQEAKAKPRAVEAARRYAGLYAATV